MLRERMVTEPVWAHFSRSPGPDPPGRLSNDRSSVSCGARGSRAGKGAAARSAWRKSLSARGMPGTAPRAGGTHCHDTQARSRVGEGCGRYGAVTSGPGDRLDFEALRAQFEAFRPSLIAIRFSSSVAHVGHAGMELLRVLTAPARFELTFVAAAGQKPESPFVPESYATAPARVSPVPGASASPALAQFHRERMACSTSW